MKPSNFMKWQFQYQMDLDFDKIEKIVINNFTKNKFGKDGIIIFEKGKGDVKDISIALDHDGKMLSLFFLDKEFEQKKGF
jgi:hypothetical protein